MKKLIVLLMFAAFQVLPSAAFAKPFIHHWKIVDLLQDGTFCFQGDDAKWYYYTLPTAQNAFLPSNVPDIFLLPLGGKWTQTNSGPAPAAVREEEKTAVQFDNRGYPSDDQRPPADTPPPDSN